MNKTERENTDKVVNGFKSLGADGRHSAFFRITETAFNENHKDYLGTISTGLAALPDTELLQVLPTRQFEYTLYGQKYNLKNIIDKYASSEDEEKHVVADALRALLAYPDSQLVKALFEREKLRTDLAHKEEFVDDCEAIIKAQRQTITKLQKEINKD